MERKKMMIPQKYHLYWKSALNNPFLWLGAINWHKKTNKTNHYMQKNAYVLFFLIYNPHSLDEGSILHLNTFQCCTPVRLPFVLKTNKQTKYQTYFEFITISDVTTYIVQFICIYLGLSAKQDLYINHSLHINLIATKKWEVGRGWGGRGQEFVARQWSLLPNANNAI